MLVKVILEKSGREMGDAIELSTHIWIWSFAEIRATETSTQFTI